MRLLDLWGQNLTNPVTKLLTPFTHNCLLLQLMEKKLKTVLSYLQNMVLGNLCCSSFPLHSPLPLPWNKPISCVGEQIKTCTKRFPFFMWNFSVELQISVAEPPGNMGFVDLLNFNSCLLMMRQGLSCRKAAQKSAPKKRMNCTWTRIRIHSDFCNHMFTCLQMLWYRESSP